MVARSGRDDGIPPAPAGLSLVEGSVEGLDGIDDLRVLAVARRAAQDRLGRLIATESAVVARLRGGGWGWDALAAAMGLSVTTVRKRAQRGRGVLAASSVEANGGAFGGGPPGAQGAGDERRELLVAEMGGGDPTPRRGCGAVLGGSQVEHAPESVAAQKLPVACP